AKAQDVSAVMKSDALSGEMQRFNIPPDFLDAVLKQFEGATEIHFTVPDAGIGRLPSPGVSGVFKVDRALQELLKGTGVDYRFTADHAVTLELRRISTAVEVTESIEALATSSPKYA